MCKKNKGLHNRIDKCIIPLIKFYNRFGYKTIASCCGHEKYKMTIVVKSVFRGKAFELLSQTFIPRTRKIYKKDKQGYYYIPEVENARKKR